MKFIPEHIRERKKREFQNLVQRDMTVAKYRKRFMELSHFITTELVATDELKQNEFIEGLWPDINKHVKLGDLASHAAAVKSAFVSEETTDEINGVLPPKPARNKRVPSFVYWEGKKGER